MIQECMACGRPPGEPLDDECWGCQRDGDGEEVQGLSLERRAFQQQLTTEASTAER